MTGQLLSNFCRNIYFKHLVKHICIPISGFSSNKIYKHMPIIIVVVVVVALLFYVHGKHQRSCRSVNLHVTTLFLGRL